jgi:hypothetical protein
MEKVMSLISKSKIQRLTELGMNFIENQIELTKLSVAETAVKSSDKVLSISIISIFSFFILVFMSLGTALWLGKVLNDMASGFFVVAAIYVVLMILILVLVKPYISKQISHSIINALDNENENG